MKIYDYEALKTDLEYLKAMGFEDPEEAKLFIEHLIDTGNSFDSGQMIEFKSNLERA